MAKKSKKDGAEYYGSKKVVTVEVTEKLTTFETPYLKVTFSDKSEEIITEKMFNAVKTDEPKDLTYIQDMRNFVLAPQLVAMVEEYDVNGMGIESLVNVFKNKLQGIVKRAVHASWYETTEEFVDGYDPNLDFKISEARNIIEKYDTKSEKN